MTELELALEKQRLLLKSTTQRQALAEYGAGLTPLFDAGDRVVAGTRWLGTHPEVVVGAVAVLVVTRPQRWHALWRWTRRGFLAWRLWQDSEHWLGLIARPR